MDSPGESKPLFTYYGDDFTGSTDALEALSIHGIASVLFLGLPDNSRLAQFRHCQAIGIAGESRSKSPDWMAAELPPVFRKLKELGAPVCQYKVCSTFDSSPATGNIGQALKIGQAVFGGRYVPIVAAAPHLKRWIVFANLFAGANGRIYRIDRHPTMSKHPVTPMTDGDLRIHLSKQAQLKIGFVDVLSLDEDGGKLSLEEALHGNPDAILFDGLSEMHLRIIGELTYHSRTPFVIGSSGFTHGLAAYLQSNQLLRGTDTLPAASGVDRVIVMSGSGSPGTAQQIRWASANGFGTLRLDVPGLVDPLRANMVREQVLRDALNLLSHGKSVVLYSALGPQDCHGTALRDELGLQMGLLLRELLLQSQVRRAVIAGGDTSSHAGQQLGVYALTMVSPLVPGAPLCRAYSDEATLSGLELVMKGGQIGGDDFFGAVLAGQAHL